MKKYKQYKMRHGEETYCKNCGMPLYTGDITTYDEYSDEYFCTEECAREYNKK